MRAYSRRFGWRWIQLWRKIINLRLTKMITFGSQKAENWFEFLLRNRWHFLFFFIHFRKYKLGFNECNWYDSECHFFARYHNIFSITWLGFGCTCKDLNVSKKMPTNLHMHFLAPIFYSSRHLIELLHQLSITVFIQKILIDGHVLQLVFFLTVFVQQNTDWRAQATTSNSHRLRRKSIWLMSPWDMIDLNHFDQQYMYICVVFSFISY